MARLGVLCVAALASSGCNAQTSNDGRDSTGSGSSAGAPQVLITFTQNTPSERIDKVTRELGVQVDQKMFERIVIGSAHGRSVADVKNAAKKYPEVVAVEPNSKVGPQ